MSEKKNELKKNEGGALGPVADYGDMANEGYENVGAADFVIPYLALLQLLSPQVDENNAAYVKGAKAGMLINTATNELFSETTIIPCVTEHLFTEWKPDRGGFVGRRDVSDAEVLKAQSEQDFGKYKTAAGNDLVESFYLYGIQVKAPDDYAPIILAFSSTKIKTYKKAMSALRTVKGVPLFANQVLIGSVPDKNDKGQPFNSFTISPLNGSIKESLLAPTDPLLLAAKAFKDEVLAGTIKVDYNAEGKGGGKGNAEAAQNAEENAAF